MAIGASVLGLIIILLFTNSWWSQLKNQGGGGEDMGVTERKRENYCLQLLSFVDHCRCLEVSTIAVSVIMNFLLDIQRIR